MNKIEKFHVTEDYNEIYILHYLSSFFYMGHYFLRTIWYNFDLM